MKPVIFGLSGPTLKPDERAFFREAEPAGYIIFKRNAEDRKQLLALTDSLRDLHGRDDLAILIDQEGGRVSRLQPPHWPSFPPAEAFDRLYDVAPMSAMAAAQANAAALAVILAEVGITVNCLPLLDVRMSQTHAAIGDRSMGGDPLRVASLGAAVLAGLRSGGVVGVLKHMPGQGRATVDSHHHLPVVDASPDELAADLIPFQRLANDASMGMTAHVIYSAWDSQRCATMSPIVVSDVIRRHIAFDGLLMSDDLDMAALSGPVSTRAAECVAAGCDVALNCWGRLEEMIAIAGALPDIREESRTRLDAAMGAQAATDAPPLDVLLDKRDRLLKFA